MADRHTWDERYSKKELVWSAEPNQVFHELVSGLTPGVALDLGCGEGRNAIFLAQSGWTVRAIDFSEVAIDKARRLARSLDIEVEWIAADVCEQTFEPGHFDLVSVVFLHTGQAERAVWLPQAINAVRPGGYFLYIGHNPSNITDGVGGPQDPAVLLGVDLLLEALDGFEPIRAEVYRRGVGEDPGHGEVAGEQAVALDTVVLARRIG